VRQWRVWPRVFAGRIVRLAGRYLGGPVHFLREFPGIFLEWRVNRTGKPIIFRDWAGNRYWRYPGDKIRSNWKAKSVTDSDHVMRYILSNVSPGAICVDIGAHIGSMSVCLWSKVGPTGKVISVEADPDNVIRLKANLRLNKCPDNLVVSAAMTDKTGNAKLRCYPQSRGWQTLGDPAFALGYKSYLVEVPTISFEHLAEMYELASVDFVKIDVEGAEICVLNGMQRFLREKRIECIIFEVNYLMLAGMNRAVPELMQLWNEFDYQLWRLAHDGSPIPIDGSWPDNVVGDCVAIPRMSKS